MQLRLKPLASKAAALLVVLFLAGFDSWPAAGAGARRGARGGPRRGLVPGRRRETISTTWTAGSRSPPTRSRAATRGSSGPAATTGSGTASREARFGGFDLLKIVASTRASKFDRDKRWNYLGVINEPCFDKPTGPDPTASACWLDTRRADCPADPFEERAEIPRRQDRRARQDRSGRLVLRLCHRHRRVAPVPQSRFRRSGGEELGSRSAITPTRTTTTTRTWCGPIASACRCGFCHVGPSPDQPAGRPGASAMGQSELERRRAVFLGRPALRLGRRPEQLHVSSWSTPTGRARWTPRWFRPTTSTIRAR